MKTSWSHCGSTVRPELASRVTAAALALLAGAEATAGLVAAQTVITQENQLSVDVSTADGRLALELRGGIWLVDARGGAANLLIEPALPARRPHWSPDGREILFVSGAGSVSQVWRVDVESEQAARVNSGDYFDRHASWHPDGQRIVFSSSRHGTGIDLWETDLQTGLSWRLSSHPGDETEAAWSADGRDLVYILNDNDGWALVLRRFGEPDHELLRSPTLLAAPSFRPDSTLVTYYQESDDGVSLNMVILAEPPLHRQLARPAAYGLTPVSWRDRERFYYTDGGRIKTRKFGDWSARTVAFRATIAAPPAAPRVAIAVRDLPLVTPSADNLVIRSARLFDGLSRSYRDNLDVLIQGGLVVEVTPRQEWPDATVIELGNTTLVPGLIDAYSALPDGDRAEPGASLLSWGVTTLVSPDAAPDTAAMWDGEQQPGPRLLAARSLPDAQHGEDSVDDDKVFLWTLPALPADSEEARQAVEQLRRRQQDGKAVMAENWALALRLGAGLVLGTEMLPQMSPGGASRPSVANGTGPLGVMSALAGSGTPGLTALFESRQAMQGPTLRPGQPGGTPDLRGAGNRIVAGSRPTGLPAGLALHAELRAMAAAGLAGDLVLKAAGSNAARMLGLGGQLGEISPGARADLLLVNGDPLANIADLGNIVAVVRNGRFYSLVALLERASGVE